MFTTGLICVASAAMGFQSQSWYDTATVYNTQHWTLRTDLAPSQAQDAGNLFDAVYIAYKNGLSMLPKTRETKMEAWVFKTKSDYTATLQAHRGGDSGVTESSAGMFFTTRTGLQVTAVTVENSWDRFEKVAKHEAFHQFAHSRFSNGMPQWLNEGIADYFKYSPYINGAIIPGQVDRTILRQVQRDIQDNWYIPFVELLRMSNSTWNQRLKGTNPSLQYRQSWSMVHFLVHGEGGKHARNFDQYLLKIAGGMGDEDAFTEAFGTNDLQAFEKSWAMHITNLKPSSTLTATHRLAFLASGMLELSRQGRTPTTLDQLRSELQSIQYNPTLTLQYQDISFNAGENKNFRIDPDSFSGNPQFVVESGTPLPSIYTTGLEPNNLGVKWRRQGGQIYWSIVVEN